MYVAFDLLIIVCYKYALPQYHVSQKKQAQKKNKQTNMVLF